MIFVFKILSLWFVIKNWWYNTLTRENNWFLNVFVKSNFATPIPFGSVSCVVAGICLCNYNLNLFLIHQASYSKGYQWYLMHREVLGSIWKIGRYPIKVSEVLSIDLNRHDLIKIWVVHTRRLEFLLNWSSVFQVEKKCSIITCQTSTFSSAFCYILKSSNTETDRSKRIYFLYKDD